MVVGYVLLSIQAWDLDVVNQILGALFWAGGR